MDELERVFEREARELAGGVLSQPDGTSVNRRRRTSPSSGLLWQARKTDRFREVPVTVNDALARDRALRDHATPRPWHEDGPSTRMRLVGPLPRSTVVVDPYTPNPQDALLLLHRVNTYEELEQEVERLRAWLRDVRGRLETAPRESSRLRGDYDGSTTRPGNQHHCGSWGQPKWR